MTDHDSGETLSAPRRARGGRPPAERAGEVEARILAAAHLWFLARGFDGASIDQIAETARCGKPTIYARFGNKEALFEATARRAIQTRDARLKDRRPSGDSLDERLASAAQLILAETLTPDFVGMLRATLAEARRAPELSRGLIQLARRRGGEITLRMLTETIEIEALPALIRESAEPYAVAARYFLDLMLLPPLVRALSGEELAELRAEAESGLARRVAFFLAGCRHSPPE